MEISPEGPPRVYRRRVCVTTRPPTYAPVDWLIFLAQLCLFARRSNLVAARPLVAQWQACVGGSLKERRSRVCCRKLFV